MKSDTERPGLARSAGPGPFQPLSVRHTGPLRSSIPGRRRLTAAVAPLGAPQMNAHQPFQDAAARMYTAIRFASRHRGLQDRAAVVARTCVGLRFASPPPYRTRTTGIATSLLRRSPRADREPSPITVLDIRNHRSIVHYRPSLPGPGSRESGSSRKTTRNRTDRGRSRCSVPYNAGDADATTRLPRLAPGHSRAGDRAPRRRRGSATRPGSRTRAPLRPGTGPPPGGPPGSGWIPSRCAHFPERHAPASATPPRSLIGRSATVVIRGPGPQGRSAPNPTLPSDRPSARSLRIGA
jgi:hypothetical protein